MLLFLAKPVVEAGQVDQIEIVYHIATLNNWEDIVQEQLSTLQKSGLSDRLDHLSVTVVGAEIDRVHQLFSQLSFLDKVKIIHSSPSLDRYEFPGIEKVQEIAQRLPEAKILYMHTKGVLHYQRPTEQNVSLWRQYMEYFTIERWRDCVSALDDVDICGVDLSQSPSGRYFSGNFWWARADYIQTCQLKQESRYNCEDFIGTGKNPTIKSFHQSGEESSASSHDFHAGSGEQYFQGILNLYNFPYLPEYYKNIKSLRVAVCYWGLTRSTKKVYKSHMAQLFQQLGKHNVHYDVYMHTWQLDGKQFINNDTIDIPVDYEEYKFLNPTFYRIDNQKDFTDKMDFSLYFYQHVWDEQGHCSHGEWPPQLIFNHLCALESQKRVTEMVLENGREYDLVIYVRPDVWMNTPLDIQSVLDLKEGEIVFPNFAHYEGYNDRFAIATVETAPIYGKRIDSIADFRATQGRIVSEKYVKYICDANDLNVRFIDFYFDLVRP
ncbi:MAG: hypothetical protein JSR37_02180 [Verrucomicrobia bacterium]|nr:hypothetical protein [Verrucomicrobiota bacterium]